VFNASRAGSSERRSMRSAGTLACRFDFSKKARHSSNTGHLDKVSPSRSEDGDPDQTSHLSKLTYLYRSCSRVLEFVGDKSPLCQLEQTLSHIQLLLGGSQYLHGGLSSSARIHYSMELHKHSQE